MTQPTSHAKGAAPDGQIKGASGKAEFSAAAEGRTSQATEKPAPEPKPSPQHNHQPKGPGAKGVTQGTAEKQMVAFHAQQESNNKSLKEKADAIDNRNQAKARDNIKGKDDLQK